MNATELFKAGQLSAAVEAQLQAVKASPGDQGKRLFLFELLAFSGDLECARRQIDALRYDDPDLETAADAYRKLLDAEQLRRQLFAGGLAPHSLAEAPEYVRLRLAAVDCLREGKPAEAQALLENAAEASPTVRGRLNGKPFDGLRDADDLFGPVLEVLSQGAYFWLPLEQVDSLVLSAPHSPRDLLWAPAHLNVRDGPEGDVFLPALYPGSHEHADDAVKLGRATDWKGGEAGPVLGAGLRTFLAGDDPITLLEWRELEIG